MSKAERPPSAITARWRSCGLLLTPLLAFNLWCARYLPPAFAADLGVPSVVAATEVFGRVWVFGLPFLMPLDLVEQKTRKALRGFLLSSLVYVLSWLPLLVAPHSVLARHPLVFLAPAYTPIGWIYFLGAISTRVVATERYRPWMYWLGASIFLVAHIVHVFAIWRTHVGE